MKICLDAGHYKNYNGGVVKGYYEGDTMWKLTNFQKKHLEKYQGVTVVLTRNNISKDLALASRGALAKGCDLFLSNHTNASSSENTDRVVVIYPVDNKNKSDVLGNKLGLAIQKSIKTKQQYQMYQSKNSSGGEYYGVMRSARATGVPRYFILEHGFHTNKATCNHLMNDTNLENLAIAEVEVIAAYYGLKKKTGTSPTNSTGWKNGDYNIKVRATANLNIRTGRGTNYPIIYTIPKGTVFTLGYVNNNWGSTWDFGKVGYFSCDYIEKA